MNVGYLQVDSEGRLEQVKHSEHDSREEAHTAAIALADSLVGNSNNILEVSRGYPISETEYVARVRYSIPPTDKQRNPS
jgi:hypothetical protein